MSVSSRYCLLAPVLVLVTAFAILVGCESDRTTTTREAALPEATIELQNDGGETVDAFPEGGAAFAAISNLEPWAAYEVTLYAPGPTAIATAETGAQADYGKQMQETKGHGPTETPGAESKAGPGAPTPGAGRSRPGPVGPGDVESLPDLPSAGNTSARAARTRGLGVDIVAAPADGAGPTDAAPTSTPAGAESSGATPASAPDTGATPAAGPDTASTPSAAPTGPVPPTAAGTATPGTGEGGATEGAKGPSTEDRDAAKAAADAVPPVPVLPKGDAIGGGAFTSDGDGKIPATLLARDLGIAPNAGLGDYTVTVQAVGGRSWGTKTFSVVASEDPYCYPCTPDGTLKTAFEAEAETMYVRIEKLPPQAEVDVYVVPDKGNHADKEQLEDVSGSITYAQADDNGHVLIDVWTGCSEPGAYDIAVDLNNNKTYEKSVQLASGTTTHDVLYGGRTTGAVIQEHAMVPQEAALQTGMACGENVYTDGLAPRIGSDQSLFVRAIPTLVGAPLSGDVQIAVVKHKDAWATGDALDNVTGNLTKVRSVGPWGIDRTLVWPAPLLPGEYDIVVDVDRDGTYTQGVDLIDNVGAKENAREVGLVVSDAGNLVAVKGKVLDGEGKPIAGALVRSDAAAGPAVETAEDGSYTLLQALPRKLTVEATAVAYQRGTVTVDAKPSTEGIAAPDIHLVAISKAGNSYMPLAQGNEWEYDLKRTVDGDVALGPLASWVGPIEYAGTLLRYVDAADTQTIPNVTLLPVVEEEKVFVTTQSAEGTGERTFARTYPVESASEGLLFRETADALPRTWLPADLTAGAQFSAWVPVGAYRVLGTATVKTAGSVTVPAGAYNDVIKVEVSVGDIAGEGLQSTNITGTLTSFFAPGVGEIKRDVHLTAKIDQTGTPGGDSLVGSVTITESLALKRSVLAPQPSAAVPAKPETTGTAAPEQSAATPAEPVAEPQPAAPAKTESGEPPAGQDKREGF